MKNPRHLSMRIVESVRFGLSRGPGCWVQDGFESRQIVEYLDCGQRPGEDKFLRDAEVPEASRRPVLGRLIKIDSLVLLRVLGPFACQLWLFLSPGPHGRLPN